MAQQKMQKVNKMPNPIGNLYTAGAVQFNTQPLVNLSMQLAARRQAKEDAFNQYLQTAASKLSPAGVRNADMPEFNDKTAAWQKFVMTHKNELPKSPELQMQANALYQQAAAVPVISKKIEEDKKPLINKLVDPNFRKQVDEEQLFPMIHAHDEPANVKDANGNWVRNPKFSPIDYTSPIFSAPNYDQEKAYSAVTKGIAPTDMPGDIVPGTQSNGMLQRKYTNQFNNGQLAQIGRNAIEYTAANKDSQRYYKQKYSNLTEEEHKKYNDIYQSVYGKGNQYVQPDGRIIDHAAVDSPDKLHAAIMIEKAIGGKKEFTKMEKDNALAMQQSMQKIYANKGSAQGVNGGGNAFDDWNETDLGKFKVKDGGIFVNNDGTLKTGEIFIKSEDLPASIKSALVSSGNKPDYLATGVNATLKDGKITSISNRYIGTVTRNSMEGVYQRRLDTEPKNKPGLEFSKPEQPSGKSTPKQSSGSIAIPKGATIGKKQK